MHDINFLISKHMVIFKLSCLFLTQISWGKRKKSTLSQSFEVYWNLPYGQEFGIFNRISLYTFKRMNIVLSVLYMSIEH